MNTTKVLHSIHGSQRRVLFKKNFPFCDDGNPRMKLQTAAKNDYFGVKLTQECEHLEENLVVNKTTSKNIPCGLQIKYVLIKCITQKSLQNVLIFRLLLKITVERLRECVSSHFLSPCGAHNFL